MDLTRYRYLGYIYCAAGVQGGGELGGSRAPQPRLHPARAAAARPLPPDVHGRGGAELQVAPRQEEQESRHRLGGGPDLSCEGDSNR